MMRDVDRSMTLALPVLRLRDAIVLFVVAAALALSASAANAENARADAVRQPFDWDYIWQNVTWE